MPPQSNKKESEDYVNSNNEVIPINTDTNNEGAHDPFDDIDCLKKVDVINLLMIYKTHSHEITNDFINAEGERQALEEIVEDLDDDLMRKDMIITKKDEEINKLKEANKKYKDSLKTKINDKTKGKHISPSEKFKMVQEVKVIKIGEARQRLANRRNKLSDMNI